MVARQNYFHTKTLHDANLFIDSLPLAINCAGVEYYHAPFRSGACRKDYSLVYVINGELDFWVDDYEIRVKQGHFIIISPIKSEFGSKGDFLNYYWLNFTGSHGRQIVEQMGFQTEKAYEIGMCDDVRELYEAICSEFILNDSLFRIASAAKLMELMTLLARKAFNSRKECLHTIEYIHRHYNENISVAALAEKENMSISNYRALFKRAMKMSPQEYILMQRINAACFYLKQSEYSVSEISSVIGYEDQFYFSRIFKKKTGISPYGYRKKYSSLV